MSKKSTDNSDQIEKISKRLDVIIRLQIAQLTSKDSHEWIKFF